MADGYYQVPDDSTSDPPTGYAGPGPIRTSRFIRAPRKNFESKPNHASNEEALNDPKKHTAFFGTWYDETKPINFEIPEVKFFTGQEETGADGRTHLQFMVKFHIQHTTKRARYLLGLMPYNAGYLAGCRSEAASIRYVTNPSKRAPGTEVIEHGMMPPGKGEIHFQDNFRRNLSAGYHAWPTKDPNVKLSYY